MEPGKLVCHICGKELSRKQTLKTHLSCIHNESVSPAKKKYKVYESNPCAEIPTTTRYRWKKQLNSSKSSSELESTISSGSQLHDFSDSSLMQEETIQTGPETDFSYSSGLQSGASLPGNSQAGHEVIPSDCPPEDCNGSQNGSADLSLTSHFETLMDVCDLDSESDSNHELSESDSESSNPSSEDDENSSIVQSFQSPPLFVLPPSSEVFKSDITHYEHLLAVNALATSGNLSSLVLENVLDLIKLHVPMNNLCEENVSDLKKKLGFDKDYLKNFQYCSICGRTFPDNIDRCLTPECGNLKSNTNYFVVGDIKKQLKEILERKGNFGKVQEELRAPKTTPIIDITSGLDYKKMTVDGGFLGNSNNNITLTFNTDGVNLFKSTNVSLWPVYLAINEIPPRERFLMKNLILWGIWQGSGKPEMNTFLGQFVRDMVQLEQEGIQLCIDDRNIQCCAKVIVGTMDLPARASVLNTTHHNGAYSCIYCESPGKVVKSGKGHARSFPYTAIPAKKRTKDSICSDIESAVLSNKSVKGFNGKCAIGCLPDFSPEYNIVIDYMHACLAGITKRLIRLFTDGTSFKEDYFIGHKLPFIDKQLKSLCVPYLINRKPRRLSHYSKWKSSEFRSWLLYYSVPCLVNILPEVYLKHYSCLVEGIHILLQSNVTEEDIAFSETLLNAFYKHAAELYGDNFVGLNVHNLSHLPNCVRKWGPLWAYSCFGFESANGEILKTIHGKKNVCSQVFWALQAQKRLEIENERLPEGQLKDFLKKTIAKKTGMNEKLMEAFQCQIFPKITICDMSTLNQNISDQLKQHMSNTSASTGARAELYKAVKIKRNGFIFYSKQCQKVKSTNSYTIALEQQLSDGSEIVQVDYYLVVKEGMKVFAVCNTFTTKNLEIPRQMRNLQIVEKNGSAVLVQASLLKEHVVFMNIDGKIYISRFPNFVERD